MSKQTVPAPKKRDTGWKKAAKGRGIYRRQSGEWGYYSTQLGRVVGGFKIKEEAVAAKAKDTLRKQSGLPAPNTSRTNSDYLDVVLEKKRRELSGASLALDERACAIMREQIGHLKPGQSGPDRLEQLEADLADGTITGSRLEPASVARYMSVLGPVFKLAVRDGAIPVSPISLMERQKRRPKAQQFKWSREAISNLIEGSEQLAREINARYDYSPIIKAQVGTGTRPSETLAWQVRDIDLLGGYAHVRHSLLRDGTLGPTKTSAGQRVIPLSPELVELFVQIIPEDAEPEDFVFHVRGNPKRALSYHNYRDRGFLPALKAAGLDGKGITPHKLRRAAVSAFAWAGMTLVEVSSIVGHADPSITAKAYADIFEPDDVHARVRQAQSRVFGYQEADQS